MEERNEEMTKEEFDLLRNLILLQLGKIEEAETLEAAKNLTKELIETIEKH